MTCEYQWYVFTSKENIANKGVKPAIEWMFWESDIGSYAWANYATKCLLHAVIIAEVEIDPWKDFNVVQLNFILWAYFNRKTHYIHKFIFLYGVYKTIIIVHC